MLSGSDVVFENGLNDIYVGMRWSGTVKVVINTNDISEGISSVINKIDNSVNSISQEIPVIKNDIHELEESVDNLYGKFEDKSGEMIFYANGGGTANKFFTELLTNVETLLPYKLIAETDIVYTGPGNNTFISINYNQNGTTSNYDIKSIKGGTTGQVYTKGTVLLENSGPTALPGASTISVGVRYSGTIKVVFDTGEQKLGLETQVNNNTTKISNHEQRIGSIENQINSSSSNSILDTYKDVLMKARMLGYRNEKSSEYAPIKPLTFMHISDTHGGEPIKRAI